MNIEVWSFSDISVFIINMHNCRSNDGFEFVTIRSLELQLWICHCNCWLPRFHPLSKKCHLAIREKGVFALWLYLSFMGLASSFILVYGFFALRVNVSKDQIRLDQGSVDLADFHICCSVFHADSRGAIHFS